METNVIKIKKALRLYATNHKYVLENTYVFNWESDFFSVTKSGNVYEYEIKISKADFKKDFEKEKHKFFRNCNSQKFMEKDPKERSCLVVWSGNGKRVDNFNYEGRGHYPHCRVIWHDPSTFVIPNRFYFVCPEGLLSIHDMPFYAGLITIGKNGYGFTELKKAPFMHKRGLFDLRFTTALMDKFYWKAVNMKSSHNFNLYELEMAKTRIKNLEQIIRDHKIQVG